jgi:hypothetical protein
MTVSVKLSINPVKIPPEKSVTITVVVNVWPQPPAIGSVIMPYLSCTWASDNKPPPQSASSITYQKRAPAMLRTKIVVRKSGGSLRKIVPCFGIGKRRSKFRIVTEALVITGARKVLVGGEYAVVGSGASDSAMNEETSIVLR